MPNNLGRPDQIIRVILGVGNDAQCVVDEMILPVVGQGFVVCRPHEVGHPRGRVLVQVQVRHSFAESADEMATEIVGNGTNV